MDEDRKVMLAKCFSEGALKPVRDGTHDERNEYHRMKATEKHQHTSEARARFHQVMRRAEY